MKQIMCACFYLHTLCLPCTFSYPFRNWTKATALLRWFATQFVFLRKFLFNYVRWNKIIAFRFPRCSAWLKTNTLITGSFLPQPLHCVTASRIVTGKSINGLEVCVHAPFLLSLKMILNYDWLVATVASTGLSNVKPLPHGTTLSAIRATVLLANRPRASTRTETSRYWNLIPYYYY